ncbi:MAG: outer membrane beta-barrel protein [Bacteroidetes bacterium]|nr:outer membrane beta-barrel protein [Bacteroidota bacterium]
MIRLRYSLGTTALAALLLSTMAQDLSAQVGLDRDRSVTHFSVMAAAGYSHTALDHPDLLSSVEHAGTPHLRAQVGYRLHPYVSVGVGMASLGTTVYRGVVQSADASYVQSGEIRALGAEASLFGHYPISHLSSLYARAGAAFLNVSQSEKAPGVSRTLHSDGISPVAGIGAEVDVLDHIGFRIGMDWYFNVGDAPALGSGTISTVYGGFLLRFVNF